MKSFAASIVLFSLALLGTSFAGGQKGDDPKEALQALQEYIGPWKGSGTSEKNKSEIWKETANWGWRFKGKEVYFASEMADSKFFKNAELRFLSAKGRYQLTVTDRMDKQQVYEGELKKDRLILERVDPDTKETQQILINPAGGGDRMVMTFSIKPENRTLYNKVAQIAYTREGITFAAAGSKKNECVVTGGLGTMAVSFKGATYFVCCTGCRDAFNDNPEKIIKEFLAKKKSGQ
jgi:YHS domain-containing protein